MTTECPGCAAIRTAQELFEVVEAFADRHDIDPAAMQSALTELLALWVTITTAWRHGQGEISVPVDGVLVAAINEFAAAVRDRGTTLPVSAAFKAASDTRERHDH